MRDVSYLSRLVSFLLRRVSRETRRVSRDSGNLLLSSTVDMPVDMWKYVDDTLISETVGKGCESNLQRVVDDLSQQSSSEGFQLNEAKIM